DVHLESDGLARCDGGNLVAGACEVVGVPRGDDDVGAFLREADADRLTDPRARTGDQGDLSREPAGHPARAPVRTDHAAPIAPAFPPSAPRRIGVERAAGAQILERAASAARSRKLWAPAANPPPIPRACGP